MEQQQDIFSKIYERTATPPADMWSRIVSKLDEVEEEKSLAPVIEMPKKQTNWFKYAAAACGVGLVAMTALWLIEKNKNNNTVASKLEEPSTITTTPTTPDNKNISTTTPLTGSDGQVIAPIVTEGQKVPGTVYNPSDLVAANPNLILDNNAVTAPNRTKQNNNNGYVDPVSNPQNNNSTNRNNNQVQPINNPPVNLEDVATTDAATTTGPISVGDKTIGSILNRVSLNGDKEVLDSIIEKSAYWKQQINYWRKELIRSGYTPSAINHLDILELKKLMDSKTKKDSL